MNTIMTLKDWLKLNPTRHKATIELLPGDEVRATLSGGEGIEERWVGHGLNEQLALGDALRVRRLVVERIASPGSAP